MDLSSTPAGTLARRWQWLLIALIVGWLIWLLAPLLTPFVCAALLGWLGDPWVDRLERSGRSRTTAVVLVFTLMLLLLVLSLVILVPMIERQVVTVIESLPAYRDHTAAAFAARPHSLPASFIFRAGPSFRPFVTSFRPC